MATLRDIRRRITGIKSTQKITKAMKMVAAAKLRRAQDAIISTRPYARKLRELLQQLSAVVDVTAHPLFTVRPPEKVAVIVVTSDRGLCGAFNSNVLRAAVHHCQNEYAAQAAAGNLSLICVGKKGYDFFRKREYKLGQSYPGIFSTLQFSDARTIRDLVVQGFLKGDYDRVEVIYNEFKSIISQRVAIEQVLPIAPAEAVDAAPPKA